MTGISPKLISGTQGTIHTYTREGHASIGDHAMPIGMGVLGASLGGAFGLLGATVLKPNWSSPKLGFAGVGAAIAAGLGAYALTWVVRERVERQPPMPPDSIAPTLPTPTAMDGDALRLKTHGEKLGKAHASWTTTEEVCTGTGDERRCHWETRHHSASSSLPVDTSIGRLDGYQTRQEAIDDLPGESTVALVRNKDRYFAYALDSGSMDSHWDSDLDSINIDHRDVTEMITSGGRTFHRESTNSSKFVRGPEIDLQPAPGRNHLDDTLGKFAVNRRNDPGTGRIDERVSSRNGYATLADALGDMKARPGTQAVIDVDRRFHVFDTDTPLPKSGTVVEGLRTTKDARRAIAMEVDGKVYMPVADYWVTRD